MRDALHAEWTKVRTTPGTVWHLLAVVAVTVALGVLAAATVPCTATACGTGPAGVSLTGVLLGQGVVAVFAVQAFGSEQHSGMLRTTLTALPRRLTVLTGKAVVVTGAVTVAATVAVAASLLAGAGLMSTLDLGEGPVLRAAGGSVLYLVLIGLLGLGVAAAVRSAAASTGVMLILLYVLPILTRAVPDPDWRDRLLELGPTTAGLAVQATSGLDDLPIGPWPGLGVLAAWAGAALVVGGVVLVRRDA